MFSYWEYMSDSVVATFRAPRLILKQVIGLLAKLNDRPNNSLHACRICKLRFTGGRKWNRDSEIALARNRTA